MDKYQKMMQELQVKNKPPSSSDLVPDELHEVEFDFLKPQYRKLDIDFTYC